MKTAIEQHTVSSYDKDLKDLSLLLKQMGKDVNEVIGLGQKALRKKDPALTEKSESKYQGIRNLEQQVQQHAVRMLALRHPVANDLLFVIAALKITSILERIGELAKKVPKKLGRMEKPLPPKVGKEMDKMASLVADMLTDSMASLVSGSAVKIAKVMKKEDKVDEIRAKLLKVLEKDMVKTPALIPASMQALGVTRNFERMGDHAVSIAKLVKDMGGASA